MPASSTRAACSPSTFDAVRASSKNRILAVDHLADDNRKFQLIDDRASLPERRISRAAFDWSHGHPWRTLQGRYVSGARPVSRNPSWQNGELVDRPPGGARA